MKRLFLATLAALLILSMEAQTFPKAILPGDYPDPSILRGENDYYMMNTTLASRETADFYLLNNHPAIIPG